MDLLLLILCLVAILLFIVNLYFEYQNRKRIIQINERVDNTIISMVESFKRWVSIKSDMSTLHDIIDKGIKENNSGKKENKDD